MPQTRILMKYEIKIKYKCLEDFVLGKTDIDPIESVIGKRYEVMDFGIYDHKLKRCVKQSKEYKEFCEQITIIKNCDLPIEQKKILCYALIDSSPTEINL